MIKKLIMMELILRGRQKMILLRGRQLKMDLLLIGHPLNLLGMEQLLLRWQKLLPKLSHSWIH